MPNEYGIYDHGRVVLEYWSGDLSFKDLVEHQQDQDRDQQIVNRHITIVDFRDCESDLTELEVRAFADVFQDRRYHGPHHRMALLLKNEDWELGNIYSTQAWGKQITVLAFQSLEAACTWLALDAGNIQTKLNELKQASQNKNKIEHAI